MAFEFIFIWTFESLFSIFIFSEKKKFSGKLLQNSRKNAGMLYKSLRRGKLFRFTLLFSWGVLKVQYGGIFTVNGFTSFCSSKSTRSLINCSIYIIANKNNPKTEVSNNLSRVKNITHETRQLLKWPARNPLSLDLKEKKNEHFCLTCRTSFKLKYLLHA